MQAPGAPTRNMPSAATLSALASVNIATSKGFTEEATFPLDETLDWSSPHHLFILRQLRAQGNAKGERAWAG